MFTAYGPKNYLQLCVTGIVKLSLLGSWHNSYEVIIESQMIGLGRLLLDRNVFYELQT
jgi:hypothetical protein